MKPDSSPDARGRADVYAFLTESLEDEHEVGVLRGVLAGARDVDATVLCVAGGNLEDPSPERRAWNFGFDVVGPENARGVLALTSNMGITLGPDGLAEWLGRYGNLPTTCIGVRVPGRPSVEVDNAGGIRALVLHLTREHGARQIGFVRGPDGGVEAELRLSAFRDALREESIEIDERLIAPGDYTKASGANAIRVILDERRVHAPLLDALVCANDFMALGAIDELGRRGLHVPEDLAVVGFDDVDSARTAHPALTTVRQPSFELGREGVRRLVAAVAKKPEQEAILLTTELVVRRSCGCLPADLGLATQATTSPGRSIETSFVQRRPIILAEVVRASRGTFGAAGAGWDARLIDALVGELRSGEPGAFLRALEHCLRKLEYAKGDVSAVQEVLSALRRQSLLCVATDAVAKARLEQAFHDARVAAAAFSSQLDATRVRDAVERFRRFERRARAAVLARPQELSAIAAEELPALGIEACVVAGFTRPDETGGPMRVLFGFGRGGTRALSESTSLRALPLHSLLERASRALIVLPVALETKPLGVAIVSVTHIDGQMLEDLRDFLATVLGVAALVRPSTAPPSNAGASR
jgi:DNA-binding LacI/PurR family transcriptional regulator